MFCVQKNLALAGIGLSMLAGPAQASADDVCALLKPFFENPPSHFIAERGTKTGDNAWNAKANAVADKLNATCTSSAYLEGRANYDCTVRFDADKKTEQDEFFRTAALGAGYCFESLSFGDEWQRTNNQSSGKDMDSVSSEWSRRKDRDEFSITVKEVLFKNINNEREVGIELYYQKYH